MTDNARIEEPQPRSIPGFFIARNGVVCVSKEVDDYRKRRQARLDAKAAATRETINAYRKRRWNRLDARGFSFEEKLAITMRNDGTSKFATDAKNNGNRGKEVLSKSWKSGTIRKGKTLSHLDADDDDLSEGNWVTLKNGHKICIDKDGNILAGEGQGGNVNELGTYYEELNERDKAEAGKYSWKELTNERLADRIDQINGYEDRSSEAHDPERQKLLEDKLWLGDTPIAKSIDTIVADLSDTGGFTYDINTGEVKQVGFAVAIEGHEKSVRINDMTQLQRKEAIEDYIGEKRAILSELGNHIGGWLNPEDGVLYLDVSKVTNSLKEARNNAVKAEQEAIYDFQTMSDIEIIKGAAQERTKQGGV